MEEKKSPKMVKVTKKVVDKLLNIDFLTKTKYTTWY